VTEDKLYKKPINNIEDFQFDTSVSEVFDDMVDRSVPGYRTLIANIGPLAAHFIQANSACYDLGCSHGAAALSVFNHCHVPGLKIHAVDNASAMIERCQKMIIQEHASEVIKTHRDNIQNITIENASFVMLNLTLQFIALSERQKILENIYSGLLPQGACLLTEKIIMANSEQEELFQVLHTGFKSANNYSDLEISQKRKSLENVLLRESLDTHTQRLERIGFSLVVPWFQCFNFVSLIAVK
jgi:tRNA (cmo5U34)-methyltransferase